ncbi:hypothetical protein JB92DRAFT_2962607 [Gautieria morchelliformis]|nr:hypothetical protein JB92DRAFT_2962607 [Gautieria morchelliformis]
MGSTEMGSKGAQQKAYETRAAGASSTAELEPKKQYSREQQASPTKRSHGPPVGTSMEMGSRRAPGRVRRVGIRV